jgi:hypothetical protein
MLSELRYGKVEYDDPIDWRLKAIDAIHYADETQYAISRLSVVCDCEV